MTNIDPAEIETWLQECGACDAGLPMGCTCPPGDYRVVLLKVWQAYQASRALVAKEIEQACKREVTYDAAARFHFARIAREIGGNIGAQDAPHHHTPHCCCSIAGNSAGGIDPLVCPGCPDHGRGTS